MDEITTEEEYANAQQQQQVGFHENHDNNPTVIHIKEHSAVLLEQPTPAEVNDRSCSVTHDDENEEYCVDTQQLHASLVYGVRDHYTMMVPSTVIRLGHKTTRIVANNHHQLLLEQSFPTEAPSSNPTQIVMQRVADCSHGSVQFLRLLYTLVAAFLVGFLVVCSLQILLFLVLNLSIELGVTLKSNLHVGAAIGIVLDLLSFMKALVDVLSIAFFYVQDVWRGHLFWKQWLHNQSLLLVEWLVVLLYLGIPLLIMSIMFFAGSSQWWKVTSLVWFYCIFLSYVLFGVTVIYCETRACWQMMTNRLRIDDSSPSFWNTLSRCIMARQASMYSGEHRTTYLALGSWESPRHRMDHSVVANTRCEWKSLLSRLTLLPIVSKSRGLPLWEVLAEPESLYNLLEARGVRRPYVIYDTWSLEKSFCWPSNFRHVVILRGPGALTKAQRRSSLACDGLGNLLMILLFAGLLVWMNVSAVVTACLVVILGFFLCLSLKRSFQLYRATQDVLNLREEENGIRDGPEATSDRADQGENLGIYRVIERRRLTRPTTSFCWFMFLVEFSFAFVWPLSTLIRVGSYHLGALFVVVVGISAYRYYINAAVVLEETGNMDWVDVRQGSPELWRKEARLNNIVGGVTQSRSRRLGGIFVGFFGIFFLALCFASFNRKPIAAIDQVYTFLPDFYYEQQTSGLAYPTCRLGKGTEDSPIISLADYSFLSNMAYRNPSITQSQLDSWFGKNVTMDNQSVVDDFRNRTDRLDSALSFKLITYPSLNISFVAISGTSYLSELLTDSQLWSAALFLQITRALLPVGRIWTPILAHLLVVITGMENRSINRVSYYRGTTAFVKEWLTSHSGVGGIQLVGHSLGGGLAIITGAQTKVNAISFSGPNAKLSRQTFDPPLSLESLNTYTFNVIPARDLVPMVDDKAELFQRIQCRSSSNELLACHDPTQTLCEILYTCGTGNRPALCECVTLNGFPQPKTRGSRTFEEACASSSRN